MLGTNILTPPDLIIQTQYSHKYFLKFTPENADLSQLMLVIGYKKNNNNKNTRAKFISIVSKPN